MDPFLHLLCCMMEKNKKEVFKLQIQQISRWWVPAIIEWIKKRHSIDVSYSSQSLPAEYKNMWFYFNNQTCLPLFVQSHCLGSLMIFPALTKQQSENIKILVNQKIKQIALSIRLKKPFHLPKLRCKNFDLKFPLLIKGKTKKDIFNTAHDLYLQTTSIAFLSGDEIPWSKKMFEEMAGVFIFISSFYSLSLRQRDILGKALKNPLNCFLVLGMIPQETPPFHFSSLLNDYTSCSG